jgi:hypothetical protein
MSERQRDFYVEDGHRVGIGLVVTISDTFEMALFETQHGTFTMKLHDAKLLAKFLSGEPDD